MIRLEDAALTWSERSEHVLAQHAKSFYWASHFLPKGVFSQVCLLYAFCRWIDDIADTQSSEVAHQQLIGIQREIEANRPSTPFLRDVLTMMHDHGISTEFALQLIEGALTDLYAVRIQDEDELLVYCYRVAGVVGLMMCPLIGVQQIEARSFAIDLGIAMQLTNICRDVAEDAKAGRVYLPQTLLDAARVSAEDLVEGQQVHVEIVIEELLRLAAIYYRSADQGLRFIPWRARISILVASRLYRAIGTRLARRRYNPWLGRVSVGRMGKVWLTICAVFETLLPSIWGWTLPHRQALHTSLQGLPGIQESHPKLP